MLSMKLFTLVFLVVALANKGTSLKCYVCHGDDCEDPFVADKEKLIQCKAESTTTVEPDPEVSSDPTTTTEPTTTSDKSTTKQVDLNTNTKTHPEDDNYQKVLQLRRSKREDPPEKFSCIKTYHKHGSGEDATVHTVRKCGNAEEVDECKKEEECYVCDNEDGCNAAGHVSASTVAVFAATALTAWALL